MDRSREWWLPPPLFAGATAFVIGGGPSLRGFDFERLRGRKSIVINASLRYAPFADILFFTDAPWFEKNREAIEGFAGLVVTVSQAAKRAMPERLLRPRATHTADLAVGPKYMRFGRSSGHTAVALAVALAAKRVVLLGYDMRFVDGVSHHHGDYVARAGAYLDFIPAFRGWHAAALKVGCEIVNATPESALKEFLMIPLDEALGDGV